MPARSCKPSQISAGNPAERGCSRDSRRRVARSAHHCARWRTSRYTNCEPACSPAALFQDSCFSFRKTRLVHRTPTPSGDATTNDGGTNIKIIFRSASARAQFGGFVSTQDKVPDFLSLSREPGPKWGRTICDLLTEACGYGE